MSNDTHSQKYSDFVNYYSARISGINLDWKEVLHLGTKMTYQKNVIIPHEIVQGIYYLAKGTVELAYNNASGQKRIALYYGPGTLVNEARTLSGHNPGGTFTCIQPVEIYMFKKNLLSTGFIGKYPHLVQNMLKGMAIKMLLHYSFVTAMGSGSHLSQLCRFIHSLAATHNFAKSFPLGTTQQEVADLMGIHRATLARLTAKLRSMRIVSHFTYSRVQIDDYEQLEELADILENPYLTP